MAAQDADPFAQYKAAQREAWASFLPVEVITTIPAAKLVKFAQVSSGQKVLDVACGAGVVAVTAARRGAIVSGLDLSPVLLERARYNAELAGVTVDFAEGDAEALPYPDASFDLVLSQFGHIFAPRPQVALSEMLRVLKVGGRLAFELAARALPRPHVHFSGGLFAGTCRHSTTGSAGIMGRSQRRARTARRGGHRPYIRTQYADRAGAQPDAFPRGAGENNRPAR